MKFAKSLLVALLLFGAIALPACCKKKSGEHKEKRHEKKHHEKAHKAHKAKSKKKCHQCK